MNENIVIGIEGLTGTGKSSICKELLKFIPNSILFNATDVYRAIAYKILEEKIDINNLKNVDIKKFYDKFEISVEIENNQTVVYSKHIKLKDENLQSPETSLTVSKISNIADNKNAYKVIYDIINDFKKKYNVIFSGRDTMKIFPEIDYHFFITADLEERIRRKCIQYKDTRANQEDIRNNIIKRDKLQKDSGFYKTYDKTIIIDVTECKSVLESTEKLLEKIKIPPLK